MNVHDILNPKPVKADNKKPAFSDPTIVPVEEARRRHVAIPYFLHKKVLLTGASSGVGKALAYWYLNNGAKVALVGRDVEALKEIGSQFSGQVLVLLCDLAEDKAQYDMASAVVEKFGGLDILINCAGAMFDGDIESTFPQDFDYLVDVNLRCPFHLMNLCAPFLEQSKGCVVNVSCNMGHRPAQGTIAYSMSKAGLEMLTKCAAIEMAHLGVRVNAVAPSTVDSNIFTVSGLTKTEAEWTKKRARNNIPLQRVATVEDIAKAVVFLSSDRAAKVTGHIMKVDGGKGLTVSGFTNWLGAKHMGSRLFEASSGSQVGYYLSKAKEGVANKSTYQHGSAGWVKDMQTSHWATEKEEAHEKVLQDYVTMTDSNQRLSALPQGERGSLY